MSSPHPKSNIASVEFAPNAGGATVIRLAYQDTDGNLRQANYDNGVWGTGAGIIVAKEGVAPLTPLSGTSKDEEVNFLSPIQFVFNWLYSSIISSTWIKKTALLTLVQPLCVYAIVLVVPSSYPTYLEDMYQLL